MLHVWGIKSLENLSQTLMCLKINYFGLKVNKVYFLEKLVEKLE